MFDIGFSEIALVAVIALLVLGPDRMPKAARTAGALVRRARASWQNVRNEIDREFAAEDLKKTMNAMRQPVEMRADLHAASTDIENSARGTDGSPEPTQSQPVQSHPFHRN